MRHMASPATAASASNDGPMSWVKTTSAWHVEASIHFVESDFVVKPFGDERRSCEYGFSGSVVSRRLVLFERKLWSLHNEMGVFFVQAREAVLTLFTKS